MAQIKIGHSYYPKSPIQPQHHTHKAQQLRTNSPFAQQLKETLHQPALKFSQHAKTRLEERGIDLSQEQLSKLHDGVQKAKLKGSNESLLLMEGLAFVVSVKNSTVITAMDQEAMTDQIITNIDSAVLL